MLQQKVFSLFNEYIDASLIQNHLLDRFRVATLGGKGTSSEYAASYLLEKLKGELGIEGEVTLYDSFEYAADAVLAGKESAVLVANAYSGVHNMYMSPQLNLAGAFIFTTTGYGIAATEGIPIPFSVRITSHPAPMPLIGELLPPAFLPKEIISVSSTSEAARTVAAGEVELALTNETSAHEYHLKFISHTRRIKMLWSLFVLS